MKLSTHNIIALAIIPARGGSKGIPRKNLQVLGGRPLLAYSIEQARKTPAIDRVVVSTDDPEIAGVAMENGAEVVWRPMEISGDCATSESALLHALDHLRTKEDYDPELVVFLQATSPLRQPDDIQNAITQLNVAGADSLFSACRVHGFIWRQDGQRLSSLSYDYGNRQRRQDLSEDLMENGSIYVFKPWVLRQCNNRLGGKITVYRMHVLESLQVDEPGDLELMEILLPLRQPRLLPELGRVGWLVLDFDGVLTDNRVLVDQEGREAVLCSRADSWGIAMLKKAGVEVVVLSTETNSVVAARCQKLKIDCIQGCDNKLKALQDFINQRSLNMEEVAFVGNDVNDLEAMTLVGVPIAVADSDPAVKALSRIVTTRPGGKGAVREVADWLLQAKNA